MVGSAVLSGVFSSKFRSKVDVMCSVINDCRLHTLAYVASSEKLYAFGSGENGQLGNNKVITVNSPVAVKNSWVANDAIGKDRVSHCSVQRIATGGDHCYVLTMKNVSNKTHNLNSVNDFLCQVNRICSVKCSIPSISA